MSRHDRRRHLGRGGSPSRLGGTATSRGRLGEPAVPVLLVLVVVAFTGCAREERRARESPAAARIETISQSKLHPGRTPPSRTATYAYDENAWAVAEGRRYYQWFNCNGCHFNGGGGIGPPLMDEQWIYGAEPENIFATIVEGRPNGMPSFRGRINDQQVWQIVAYVRSLGGLTAKTLKPGRPDTSQPESTPPGAEANSPQQSN